MSVPPDMPARWDDFIRRADLYDPDRRVYRALIEAYSGAERRYHTLDHIQRCLIELDVVRDHHADTHLVEAAIWFHDVVYDSQRQDNELRSADWAAEALRSLGMTDRDISQVEQIILDTRHTTEPATQAGKLMADIDLANMGLSADVFDAQGRDIRAEFPHLDDATYNPSQAVFFRRLLERPAIYYLPEFSTRYETAARENLSRGLTQLQSTHDSHS